MNASILVKLVAVCVPSLVVAFGSRAGGVDIFVAAFTSGGAHA